MNDSILTSNVVDLQSRIVSRERNLDFGQLFYASENRKIFVTRLFQSEITDGNGNRQNIRVVVKFDPTLGTLNTFDERMYYVMVELWEEQSKPPIVYFSERQIARRLNIKWDGGKSIRESLFRLRGVFIEWDGSFFHKQQQRYISIANPFTILSHLQLISTKDEGIGSQIAEFSFDQKVVENLNSNYTRPIMLDTVLSFSSPLAQAIYTLLDRKLYATNHYHRTTAGLLIEDLGLIGSSYQRKAKRVQVINRAKNELVGKPFYYDEVIEKIEIKNGKQDAIFHAYRSGADRIKGVKPEVVQTSSPPPKPSTPQNRREAPSKAQKVENPTPPHSKPATDAREAKELLQYFTKTFHNQEQGEFTKNALLKAQEIINKHGMEQAKFFVRFAQGEANQTNYKPDTFNGILKYLTPAIAEFERQQRIAKLQADEMAKTHLENARYDHQKAYEDFYYQYVDELFCLLKNNNVAQFNKFQHWQAEKRKEKEQIKHDGNRALSLKVFDRKVQELIRFIEFFQDDPDLQIPDFWEWDEKDNPNSFSS